MSQYKVPHQIRRSELELIYGYDRPLQEYFATVSALGKADASVKFVFNTSDRAVVSNLMRNYGAPAEHVQAILLDLPI